jgi:hypothetical protein
MGFFISRSESSRYLLPPESFPKNAKNGRYIEMTIEPILTPNKAICAGAIIAKISAIVSCLRGFVRRVNI